MPGSELIQSVLRATDVLGLLARHPEGLPLSAVCERLELKSPTAHKLLRTLAARGYVERLTAPIRYRLGPAAAELVRAQWEADLMAAAERAVGDMAGRFPEAVVTFSRPIGGDVLIMLRAAPERPGFVQRGALSPMHPYGTASALVLQAFWTDEERAAYRERHPFWQFGAHLWDGLDEVDAFLAESRDRGYCAPDPAGRSVHPIAAPVFGPGGALAGALGIALPVEGTPARRVQEAAGAVVEQAERLSSAGEGITRMEELKHADSGGG